MSAGRQTGNVRVQVDAGVDGNQQDAEDERPWQQGLQILAGRTREGAAEQVREHHGEQDRDEDRVGELLRHVFDLQQGSPGEGERSRQRGWARWTRPGGQRITQDVAGGRLRDKAGGHAEVSWWSLISAGCPVRARNTSSRLGWPTA
jgi:hypothetical protein